MNFGCRACSISQHMSCPFSEARSRSRMGTKDPPDLLSIDTTSNPSSRRAKERHPLPAKISKAVGGRKLDVGLALS